MQHGFADNHTVQINFTPMIIVLDAIKNLDKSLEDISERMCLNRLKMNPTKTEFSLFGSRHQTAKCTVTSINVVGEGIARCYLIKHLSTRLNQHLTFNDHIINKCKTAKLNVLQIKLMRNYIDHDTCIILIFYFSDVSIGLQ